MSVKISELTAAANVTSNDLIPIVDNETAITKKATAQQVLEYVTGSTFDNLTVANTISSSRIDVDQIYVNDILLGNTITGDGSGLSNLTAGGTVEGAIQYKSGNTFAGADSLTYDPESNILNGITAEFTTVNATNISGVVGEFTNVSSSNVNVSGNLVLEGPANLSEYPDYAYIIYTSSYDKLVVYPGLYVSGNLTGSGLGAFQTISASNYLGLPPSSLELTKLTVTSSVSLTSTQRAVFAKNTVNSSISITLPSISSADSKEYYIIKADSLSGSVIISGSSPNLINGQATYQLNGPYQSVTLIHDGADWYVF